MKMKQVGYIFIFFTVLLHTVCLPAQTAKALKEMQRGDSLREQYSFKAASEAYLAASAMFADSLLTADDSLLKLDISDRLLMAENGISMMDFVYVPDVVARHKFPIDDFFLYYPLAEGAWRAVPSQLDSIPHEFSKASYVIDGKDDIYWSAVDKAGIRNIYHSVYQDTIWSVPTLLNEHMTSASDEIYPMLSPDGKKMFFSSAGLYGVGGYDIYVSEWDEGTGDWSVPVNMGFPYSSPADDFLYVNTEDGRYSVFASNRDCSKDSVWVYVLEFDNMPVRKAVDDPAELKALAALNPQGEEERINAKTGVEADIPENQDTERYMNKMSEVRALRDTISHYNVMLDHKRSKFALSTDEDERMDLTNEILAREAVLPHFQDSLDKAVAELQKIEMEFLFKGVVIDPDKLLAKADQEVVGEATSYTFSKRDFGSSFKMDFMKPEVKFDYSFKILPEGCFAEDNTIPQGIVYQIQIFSSSNKAGIKSLKGLSPVFERKTVSGRYVYRVGLFSTYKDVLSHLNAVKKVGFRSAFIVAYIDGKEISVAKARTAESDKVNHPTFYEVQITFAEGDMDPATAEEVRLYSDGKDIAKMTLPEGGTVYKVGPYTDKGKADQLVTFIRDMGVADVACNVLGE